MLVVFLAIPPHIIASDRDTPAFLIYVDPETGKYTKKKPEHDISPQEAETGSADSDITRPDLPASQLGPAFLIAVGLLLTSHVLSLLLVSFRK